MCSGSLILLFAFATPLVAQLASGQYPDNRERFNSYLYRTYADPVRLGWLLVDSAQSTWFKDPHQWDRSAKSYSYRVASGMGRRMVRNTALLGFETLLHEDSLYRPSLEHGLAKRTLFALRHSVLAYKPDGSVEPAYARIAAGVVAAATSSTWHPQSIEPCQLLSGVGQSTLDRAGNNLLTEFEPDLRRFGRKAWNQLLRK
jgi:hypothetical protein